MNVGAVIRRLRKEKGDTLAQMAKQINCDLPYLSRLENNKSDFSKSKYLEEVCKYFKVPLPIIYMQSLEITDAPKENREEVRVVLEHLNQTYMRLFTHKEETKPQNKPKRRSS